MSDELIDREPESHTRVHEVAPTIRRIQGEFNEMPGLQLTEVQARKLWGLDGYTCRVVLCTLLERRFLKRTATGAYVQAS